MKKCENVLVPGNLYYSWRSWTWLMKDDSFEMTCDMHTHTQTARQADTNRQPDRHRHTQTHTHKCTWTHTFATPRLHLLCQLQYPDKLPTTITNFLQESQQSMVWNWKLKNHHAKSRRNLSIFLAINSDKLRMIS